MADVSIDASISTATARGMRSVVFTTDLIGYVFYIDSSGALGYSKTTDGGGTWGAWVSVTPGDLVAIAFDVWYDRWTPGDTGTLIHIWWFEATNDTIRWRAFDTATDTVPLASSAFVGASAVAGRGAFVSGCKARSGYLYCAYDIDAGAERGFHVNTNPGVVVWSANLSTTFVEATLDTCKLYPASGTGDDNDCWALYYDASATALTLKLWDYSAVAQVESATIGVAHTDGATDLTGQFGYDGAVRHSDGHLIVAALSARDVAASTHQVFDITSTSTITTKTAIAASTDDHYYPQVTIDQSTNNLYVAYNGKRDGSEVLDTTTKVYYTKSTDGGATWSAGDTAYMEGAAGVVAQVWTPLSGPRFYAVWRVGSTLVGNKVNSVGAPLIGGATIAAGLPLDVLWVENVETTLSIPPMTEAGYGHGQSISGHTRVLSAVGLYLRRVGAPTDAVYVQVHQGSLHGTLLATSATYSCAAIPTVRTLLNFPLPPITLAAGTTYFIEVYLTRVSSDSTNYLSIYLNNADNYAGGNSFNLAGTSNAFADVLFRLYTPQSHTVEALPAGPSTQSITGATLISTSVVYSPQVVTPGAVTLTGTTLTSGAAVTAGTVAPGAVTVTVTGTTLTSSVVVRAGTVAPGAVTTTGATISSGVVVRAGSVTPGAVTVTGTTLTSGAIVRVGSVTTLTAVSGATLSSTVTLTAGSVTTTTTVTGATLTSGAQLFAGTVTTTTSVTGTTLASTLGLFPGTVSLTTAGAIDGAVILNSAALFPGLVTPGAVLVTGASRGTSAQVFPGALAAAAVAVVTDEPFAWLM